MREISADFNKMAARMKDPLWSQIPDKIFLALDRAGNILHIFENFMGYYVMFSEFLRQRENVYRIFDISQYKDLDHAVISKPVLFPLKRNLLPQVVDFIALENYCVNFPLARIDFFKTGKDLFLGVVTFSRVLPNIYSPQANLVLFVDTAGLIQGFNQAFFQLFAGAYKDPRQLLEK
jgi:hypothetical protein